ncbi:MAG: hypothetical protein HOY76_37575 [Streptomyces sp.]|nr:hypothetical protein [Streptomyces sp.]NUS10845.1 hypothetical protein [Streptomyces sp.]
MAGKGNGKGADRTKYGATPKRPPRASGGRVRRRPGGVAVAAGAIGLVAVVAGVMITLSGVAGTAHLAASRGRPELRMTISSCSTVHHGRNSDTTCHGHGDPGSTGVTPETWQILHSPEEYAEGAVVSVHCTLGGTCTEVTLRSLAADLMLLGFGLLLAGNATGALLYGLADTFAPGRTAIFSRRSTVRAAFAFNTAALTLAAGSLIAFFAL